MCLRRLSIFILIAGLATACEHPLPVMDGINLLDWKNDKNGCAGKRLETLALLRQQKNKLQGLSEMQIISLLGRPDQNELYSRNQKFYYYYLKPGKTCGKDSTEQKLSVRFNATGRAKEVEVE